MTEELFSETFWNERYRSHPKLWSGNPNLHLVAETSDLPPGTALDVACGEGADAVWLAERGWRVTALDISTVALERAAAHAGTLPIEWRQADLITWEPGEERYDLISAQYMHLPPEPRDRLFRHLAAAVKPGGTLLLVGHHPSDLHTAMQRPDVPELLFTGADVKALLEPAEWTVVTDTDAARDVTNHEGQSVTIHDAVFRARRSS
jgi:2-polyprenyl-3-methyl-5-hydroxy-6-metoxy-1,4-benzoquinol methylase